MVRKGKGWHGESRRHGLSRKGVRTKSGVLLSEAIREEKSGKELYNRLLREYPEHRKILEHIISDEEFHSKLLVRIRDGKRISDRDLVRLEADMILKDSIRDGNVTRGEAKIIRDRVNELLSDNRNSQLWKTSGLATAFVFGMVGAMGKMTTDKIVNKGGK